MFNLLLVPCGFYLSENHDYYYLVHDYSMIVLKFKSYLDEVFLDGV